MLSQYSLRKTVVYCAVEVQGRLLMGGNLCWYQHHKEEAPSGSFLNHWEVYHLTYSYSFCKSPKSHFCKTTHEPHNVHYKYLL